MKRPRKRIAAIVLLVLFGIVRIPLESRVESGLRAQGLHHGAVDVAMRDQLGQASFAAVLGGFRSLVASIVSLQATTAWENVAWGEVDSFYGVATRLQPRVEYYWEVAHWHMAYNAASYYFYDGSGEGQSQLVRQKLYQEYIARGQEYLRDGMANLPDSYRLPAAMAELYRRRTVPREPCKVAEYFQKAVEAGAPSMYRRFHATALAQCPGQEEAAYGLLRGLFLESERHRKPTLLKRLGELEERLQITPEDRLVPRQ